MKNRFFLVALLCMLLLPMVVFADSYTSLNLDEALTEEQIDHDFSNYEETDDQVIIYLFRGKGCQFCRAFLTYLNSIVDEYGDRFKVVSYEVWNNTNNSGLLNKVASFMGFDPTSKKFGVPFIVIGDTPFDGYNSSYDTQIVDAINKEYAKDVDERYDILEEVNKGTTKEESTVDNGVVIAWTLVFLVISTTIILITVSYQNSKINNHLMDIEKSLNIKGRK